MFKLCRFPKAWKKAKLITQPKPGKDPSKPVNRRSISLLNSMSKIFGKALLYRLQFHADVNKIIPDNQYGFRAHHGTIHPLIKIVEDITVGFNNKEQRYTIITLLDAEKAFDKPHTRFYVTLDGIDSNTKFATAGVPQESALSPFLYSIYTAGIPITDARTNANIQMYADYTAIIKPHYNVKYALAALQRQLPTLEKWYTKWRNKINPGKSETIIITKILPR
ncbi:hypothetical protein PR048_013874 [Dryococelus australis]|uniref:Reverse transcriptase domain-containing protein n=1 Tax=Dryococelus australis TaxID=614101 RepID=A0ABQ9HTF3_9NEOP|nr:hypothetical protein PR048_013874 [Dryococelus australis]